jgi:uncharacterized membrane protein YraQ (UPF0718 family)
MKPPPDAERPDPKPAPGRLLRRWAFLLAVAAAYLVLLAAAPGRAQAALRASGRILLQVALPLAAAFVLMFLVNLFMKPAHIARFMGAGAGLKGILFSTSAGILSTGPVYAWYPLLKSLSEKGASAFHLANFLSSRAVKPYLLPLMVYYFGWTFTLTVSVLTVVGALPIATVVALLADPERRG